MTQSPAQFNKMFVMLPVMLAARKLDGENPTTIYWLRITYGVVQVLSVLIVAYVYVQARSCANESTVVYVPPPATPFADPNAKKKYTATTFGKQVTSTARSLLASTLFGFIMTVGLHYWKGMLMGLAIQTVMAPLNLYENALVKAIFFGNNHDGPLLRPQDKVFGEKLASDLTTDDEVVDEHGNPVARTATSIANAPAAASANGNNNSSTKSLEDVLLDTWDAGAKADLQPLLMALDKKNVNFATSEDQWTALMILAGLGAPGTADAIRQVVALGANVAQADKEGWTCLHWAAFHGSTEAAHELKSQVNLLSMRDKEGLTPLEMARKENNTQVADILKQVMLPDDEPKKTK